MTRTEKQKANYWLRKSKKMLTESNQRKFADRNRRWEAAINDCMEGAYHFECWNYAKLAAVFDAIASEASCGEIHDLLRR
jgi:hypothetical protein